MGDLPPNPTLLCMKPWIFYNFRQSWAWAGVLLHVNNYTNICRAPLKIKFARGALQSKRTQRYKGAKPAKSDEVKSYIKASSNSTVVHPDNPLICPIVYQTRYLQLRGDS
jgi:hypothetical protein